MAAHYIKKKVVLKCWFQAAMHRFSFRIELDLNFVTWTALHTWRYRRYLITLTKSWIWVAQIICLFEFLRLKVINNHKIGTNLPPTATHTHSGSSHLLLPFSFFFFLTPKLIFCVVFAEFCRPQTSAVVFGGLLWAGWRLVWWGSGLGPPDARPFSLTIGNTQIHLCLYADWLQVEQVPLCFHWFRLAHVFFFVPTCREKAPTTIEKVVMTEGIIPACCFTDQWGSDWDRARWGY